MSVFSEEQRRKYFHRMAVGEFLGAFSMSEPGAGSDVASLSARAVRDWDDWLITGSKYWCTFADAADFIVVIARTSPVDETRRHVGISAFLVEKERYKFPPGLSGQSIPKIGYFGWKTWNWPSTGSESPPQICSARKVRRSTLSPLGSRSAVFRPLRALSRVHAARSKTLSPMRKDPFNSASRSLTFRRFVSSLRIWRQRSRRRVN
jgi:hypothetical protein